jgi:hypothetical protein
MGDPLGESRGLTGFLRVYRAVVDFRISLIIMLLMENPVDTVRLERFAGTFDPGRRGPARRS